MNADLPPPGTVLRLAPDDWRYHGAQDGDLVLNLVRYREDISQYYDDEVWVEGTRLDELGQPMGVFQALVRRAALAVSAENRTFGSPDRATSIE